MKVFLDDVRDAPEGWVHAKTVEETLDYLRTGEVTQLSLDHDLGTTETGYDVILWIETAVVFGFEPPEIIIHSANPVGRQKMQAGIDSIIKSYKIVSKEHT